MNRGSGASLDRTVTVTLASMRPRFMNRGSPPASGRRRRPRAGFNEAPIHESGKYFRSGVHHVRDQRFNEAPIHESGKSDMKPRIGPYWPGFNEAPIHESGK